MFLKYMSTSFFEYTYRIAYHLPTLDAEQISGVNELVQDRERKMSKNIFGKIDESINKSIFQAVKESLETHALDARMQNPKKIVKCVVLHAYVSSTHYKHYSSECSQIKLEFYKNGKLKRFNFERCKVGGWITYVGGQPGDYATFY